MDERDSALDSGGSDGFASDTKEMDV